MITTVLFDLDGTLLDSEPDFTHILNTMLAATGRRVDVADIRRTVSNGARAMVEFAYGIDDTYPEFESFLNDFLDHYEALIPQTRSVLFDGVARMLETLEEQDLQWGVVTNKSSRFTVPLLRQFPEFSKVGAVVSADQVRIAKPDPEGLFKACAQSKTRIEQAIYVGDHPRDIEAARNAGMPGVAVTWGYLPASPPVTEWQAHTILDHPDQLSGLLHHLQSTSRQKD